MYAEFVKSKYDVIASYSLSTLPRPGDYVEINEDNYIVKKIEWYEVDIGSDTKELRPIIKLAECFEFEKDEDLKKKLEHTEEWYAVRLEALKDWARKNDYIAKEFFQILANGHLLHDPPTYAQQITLLKHKLKEKCKKCNKKQPSEDFRKSFSYTNSLSQTNRPKLAPTSSDPSGYEIGQKWLCDTGEIIEITGKDGLGFGKYYINHTHSYIDLFDKKIWDCNMRRYKDIKLVQRISVEN